MTSAATPGRVVVACPCAEVYELRVEYAGRLLECPRCGRHLRAGGRPPREPAAVGVDPAFERDIFLLRQRFFTVRSKYEVWSADGQPILYVERPTYPVRTFLAWGVGAVAASITWSSLVPVMRATDVLAGTLAVLAWMAVAAVFVVVSMSARPLRHVTVYRDERRREKLLAILQDQRVAILVRTYTIADAGAVPLARLRKNYVHNLVRKRWDVTAVDGRTFAVAREDSIVLSLLRRLLGPLFGLLRTDFVLLDTGGEVLGEFRRRLTLLDRYVLDLGGDPARSLDRRVALALGVMLDTGERR